MSQKVRIKRDYEKCSGCRRCEIACSLHHEGKIWPEASRIRVFMFVPGVEIPHLCFQCEDYPCVGACPVEALSVDDNTGAVKVDEAVCTGCGSCIEACPGKVPHMHPQKNKIVICDLCDGEPKCVETCQRGEWNALTLVQEEEDISHEDRAKSPTEITKETAEKIFGKEISEEVLGQ